MNITEPVGAALEKAGADRKAFEATVESYPEDIISLLIFHRLHFHMDPAQALKAYGQLQTEFVDWNEVRVSPIREIQEQLSRGQNSLELSVYCKDLLEFVHADRHQVSLENLVELNLTDIRRYLKGVRDIDPSSIELVLLVRRNHPVVPLTAPIEEALLRAGVISEADSRDRRQKGLYELVGGDAALVCHHLMVDALRGHTQNPTEAPIDVVTTFLSELTGKSIGKSAKRRTQKKKKKKKAAASKRKANAEN